MRGFTAVQISAAAVVDRDHLRRRPALLGQPLQEPAPDDDHPVRHPRRGARWSRRASSSTTPPACRGVVLVAAAVAGVRVVRAGRRDTGGARAAGRHLRALPPRPRGDHGPVLGVPGDRPDHRRAHRRVRGRCARHRRHAHRDGRLAGDRARSARPVAPRRGRARGAAPAVRPSRRIGRHDGRPATGPGRRSPAGHMARSSRHTTSRRRPDSASCARVARRSMPRSRRMPSWPSWCPELRDRRRRVLADLGRGDRATARPERLGSVRRRGATRRGCATRVIAACRSAGR